MLVLARKVGEKIIIEEDIVLVVTDIRGDKVRIGIEAPKDIQIMRSEVLEKGRKHGETNDEG